MFVDYGEGYSSQYLAVTSQFLSCELDATERITAARIYRGEKYGVSIILGLEFITNVRSCGLFDEVTEEIVQASGHQLLYMDGKLGSHIIRNINLYFDYDCDTGV